MWLLKRAKKLDASKGAHADRKKDARPHLIRGHSRRQVIATQSYATDGAARKGSPMSPEDKAIITSVLSNHFLFDSLKPAGVAAVLSTMLKSEKVKGDRVIVQGDKGDIFYILSSGSVSVSVNGVEVSRMDAPCSFGELALMYNKPRAATITCTSNSQLWDINQKAFRTAVASHKTNATLARVKFLRSVQHLGKLSDLQLTRVADALNIVHFKAGETIIRQGQQGENFFVIESGTVKVTAQNAEKKDTVTLATLSAGKYFGEAALLKKEPRNATCSAVTNVICASLSHDEFNTLLGPLSGLLCETTAANEVQNKSKLTSSKNVKVDHRGQRPKFLIQSLAEFQVERIIGQGTFGRVKIVRHKQLDTVMAMKCMSKHQIVAQKQVKNVMNEKNSLAHLNHPFVVTQYGTWQDPDQIYVFLEIVQGGELWSLIYQSRKLKRTMFGGFEENTARMYACTVITALVYIHSQDYVYRDLKPENLLIDRRGYLKIVDFGFAKRLRPGEKSHTLCGTPEYLAPELVCARGHNKGADYWAFGVLCYELMVEVTPFADPDQQRMFEKISKSQRVLMFPRGFPKAAKELITKLLNPNPGLRLGCGIEGGNAVKNHRWFTGIDWNLLERRRYRSPYSPPIKSSMDVGNFDKFDEEPVKPYHGSQKVFEGF